MKRTLILLILPIFFFACKKNENNNQYSRWRVNNDSFATNEVSVEQGKAVCIFNSNDLTTGFDFTFYTGGFPFGGPITLGCRIHSSSWTCFDIRYKGVLYMSNKESNYMTPKLVNEKVEYTLDLTWLFNVNNPNDSVLVSGIFCQP